METCNKFSQEDVLGKEVKHCSKVAQIQQYEVKRLPSIAERALWLTVDSSAHSSVLGESDPSAVCVLIFMTRTGRHTHTHKHTRINTHIHTHTPHTHTYTNTHTSHTHTHTHTVHLFSP